jgi:peptidoglycan hydrolase-like protein with peptidoglycan-binding domain
MDVSVVTKAKLLSELFRDNDKLQRCLHSPADHVVPGSHGPHVGLIQQALTRLGEGVITLVEVTGQVYGASTERAVRKFKGPPRNIINTAYQKVPDGIVGQMTIDRLDDDIAKLEVKPPSQFVSLTKAGAPHDHAKCPRLQIGDHERTPINPQGFGRKINIFGAGETDYLGFEDFSTRAEFVSSTTGRLRPLTFVSPALGGLKDSCASDICMRSSPVTEEDFTRATGRPNTVAEIRRIAMPGCRIVFAGEESEARKLFGLGPVIERVEIEDLINDTDPGLGTKINLAFVLVFMG